MRSSKERKRPYKNPERNNDQHSKYQDIPCHHFSAIKNADREQIESRYHCIDLYTEYSNLADQIPYARTCGEKQRGDYNTQCEGYTKQEVNHRS